MPSVNTGDIMQSYALFNAVVNQMTGNAQLAAHDASTFLACAHVVTGLGKDNFSSALTQVIAETYFYQPKTKVEFEDIVVNADKFGALRREIACADIASSSDPQFSVSEGDTAGTFTVENLPKYIELGWVGDDVERISSTMEYSAYLDAMQSIEQFNKLAALRTGSVTKALKKVKAATARTAVLGLIATLIADVSNHPERVVDITDIYCLKRGYVDGNGKPNKTYADIVALGEEKEFWQEYANQQDIVTKDIEADTTLYKNNITGKVYSESVPVEDLKGYMLAQYQSEIKNVVRPMLRDNGEFKYKELTPVASWQAFTDAGGSIKKRDAINFKGVVTTEATGACSAMSDPVSATGIISVMFAPRAAFCQVKPEVTLTSQWDIDKLVQKTTTHLRKLPVINPYHKAVVFKLH